MHILHSNDADHLANAGMQLNANQRFAEALLACEAALEISPSHPQALVSRSLALLSLHRFEECIVAAKVAMSHYPHAYGASINLAAALAGLWRNEEALAIFDELLQTNPFDVRLLHNSGVMLIRLGRNVEAIARLKRAASIDTSEPWLLGTLLALQMGSFDWDNLDTLSAEIDDLVREGSPAVEALRYMAICNDPALLYSATKVHAARKMVRLGTAARQARPLHMHQHFRIGYFSSDFREHPVGHLLSRVLELHDRTTFEIHAISFLGEDSPQQLRIRQAVDYFHDVESLAPQQMIEFAHSLELDIAIDLNGHTQGSRPFLFTTGVAPIQINYLGFPGGMATDCMDYILADEIVIPRHHQEFYAEKTIWMPHSFQPFDDTRPVVAPPSRHACELPEDRFVYCCFNGPQKLSPMVFDQWAAILHAVEDSVLWLYAGDCLLAQENLRVQARKRGVSPERIVFAPRVDFDKHIARQACADLFLDTMPFNAGATAASTLWGGLPILTCLGETFSGRYGASLLCAAGLSELIAPNMDAYRRLAIDIGRNPNRAKALKTTLRENRTKKPLFDIRCYTENLERAYLMAISRAVNGLPPDHIKVDVN